MSDHSALLALWNSRFALLNGLGETCLAACLSVGLGIAIGALAAVTAVFGSQVLRTAISLYIYLLRGLPLLVIILFAYFGVGALWPALPAFALTVAVMALFAGAQFAEILRGAIQAIPHSQFEAAKAIGLTFPARIVLIVLPLALRRAIPSATNIAIEIIKSTTLISVLGVSDLFLAGQQVAIRTLYIPETYLLLWLTYVVLCLVTAVLGSRLEQRFAHISF